MKLYVNLFLLISGLPLMASVSMSTFFGNASDSTGSAVPDGTLWAMVVDDGDNLFSGFGLDGNIYSENISSPGVADSYFSSGQGISLGSVIGGGTIFAIGGINGGDGSLSGLLSGLEIGTNGLASGAEFAFYWFPGSTFSGLESDPQTISNQVGGLQNNTIDVGVFFDTGMVIPPDGSPVVGVGAAGSAAGGSISNDSFRAVTLVPEPSAALMGVLGSLALLRRRRVAQA